MKEKILIIDDEAEIRKLLREVLTEEGYEVVEAENGARGLEIFHSEAPGLVITDIRMPEKNGLEFVKELKDSGFDTDVIILTGQSSEAAAIEFLRSGAYDYLLKPLEDPDILLKAVHRVFEKRKLKLENASLILELEEMAIKDPLTGCYNFRYMQSCIDDEIDRSSRYDLVFGVLMIDIDHFKKINDTHGHLFGDHVLKTLGALLQKSFRTTDRIFRYGGEEFFVIMPQTEKFEATAVVDRFLNTIRNHVFENDGQRANITVSVGAAFFPYHCLDKFNLIKLADQFLYQAKKLGRDRAVFQASQDEHIKITKKGQPSVRERES